MSAGATRTSATPTCVLTIGDRVVLRASAPPDAEYALFETSEIELRATEPGRVREHGYQTTAETARTRLASLGFTPELAEEVGRSLQPALANAYARGKGARRLARYFGPSELLRSDTYDAASYVYRGVFLDLAALANDLSIDHASATLQALHLAMVLADSPPDAAVVLVTAEHTKQCKPGVRTHKRPTFADPKDILDVLGRYARGNPQPAIKDTLSRKVIIDFLRERADDANDDDERALYRSLEGSFTTRDMPDKGPLAAPELWAIELRLDRGDGTSTIQAIDDIERRQGRSPGTAYLRARASLLLELEAARLIAERVSALALSMTSFHELALLAAEAWLAAGEPRRAIPYARDVVDKTGADEGLWMRAEALLARALESPPDKRQTILDTAIAGPKPSRPPPPPSSGSLPPSDGPRPARRSVPAEIARPLTQRPPMLTPPERTSFGPTPPLPPMDLDVPEAPARAPSVPPVAPPPNVTTTPSVPPASDGPRPSRRPRTGAVIIETKPPPSFDPRAEPEVSLELDLGRRLRSERPTLDLNDDDDEAVATPRVSATLRPPVADAPYMEGAGLPPFQTEDPAPLLPRAPLFPPPASDELVEHLALPAGVSTEKKALETLPTSVLEARIQLTLLARELGLDYRLKRGITLRADLSGIEAMQTVLLESFPDHAARNADEAYELRRHGALLSEILSRKLEAEWLDITPKELGLWAMIVPPSTRVWPFGRVARFVAMGHRERDLVSYFLELKERSRAR